MNLVGYVRSTPREGEEFTLSAEDQSERIQAYVRLAGLPPPVVLVDDGVAGSVPLEARPAGGQLLRQLQGCSGLVVARLDRVDALLDQGRDHM